MANRYLRPDGSSQREDILEFLREHPQSTSHDLRDEFGIEVGCIGTYLNRLKTAGLAFNERNPGELLARWSAVDEDDLPDAKPVQIVRQQWVPEFVRDPFALVPEFFRNSQSQQ